MKKIFTFLLLSLSSIGFSQQGVFHYEGQPIGSSFVIDSATVSIDHFGVDFYLVNTGLTNLNLSYSRERIEHTTGWTDQICDNKLCFNAADANLWTRPQNPPTDIAPGDSSILQFKVYPHNINGCAVYKYIIEGQNHTFIDSITISYTIGGAACNVGTQELNSNNFNFSVYPNPATDVLNINIENLEGNASVAIYDIVGKQVASSKLSNGKNILNVESLTSGVYFYSIRKDNAIIETKKVVIQ